MNELKAPKTQTSTIREVDRHQLLDWFQASQRPLPWRRNRDPFAIWISETMLQQTTTTAVIPFFHRFMERFPDLRSLAAASEAEVKKYWAGLGYYSRASNLWRAAGALNQQAHFPRSHVELLEFPGFGPYTARAVASLAFGEAVGVLDGNVIRVLSRYLNWALPWWQTSVRKQLQGAVDQWVQGVPSEQMNQALMELGATICTPKSPTCMLCPLRSGCGAWKTQKVTELPLVRPRRAREIWLWQAEIYQRGKKIALVQKHSLPFLRQHWVLPGSARLLKKKPAKFDFSHSITHHDIFVQLTSMDSTPQAHENLKWVRREELTLHAPSSLVQKALDRL